MIKNTRTASLRIHHAQNPCYDTYIYLQLSAPFGALFSDAPGMWERMSAESDLLVKGLSQFETGDRRGAARHFVDILRQDPNAEKAWWLLASCVDTPEQKRECLQRVLEINPWNEEARDALEQLDFAPPDSLALAKSAEAAHDYEAAYQFYSQAVENDPACVDAWLGKGFTAGMLSTPETNGVRMFFQFLEKGLRSAGMETESLQGPALGQIINRLSRSQVKTLTGYFLSLFDYITGLADRCPANMANIYAVERVHLADWAHFTQRLLNVGDEGFFSREKLIFIVVDAYTHIAGNIRSTTRGPRSRRELLGTYKFFLLSNLSLSKLNQDTHLLDRLDGIQLRHS